MSNQEVTGKRCSVCKVWKPYSSFYTSSTTRDGYRYDCAACARKAAQERKASRQAERNGLDAAQVDTLIASGALVAVAALPEAPYVEPEPSVGPPAPIDLATVLELPQAIQTISEADTMTLHDWLVLGQCPSVYVPVGGLRWCLVMGREQCGNRVELLATDGSGPQVPIDAALVQYVVGLLADSEQAAKLKGYVCY